MNPPLSNIIKASLLGYLAYLTPPAVAYAWLLAPEPVELDWYYLPLIPVSLSHFWIRHDFPSLAIAAPFLLSLVMATAIPFLASRLGRTTRGTLGLLVMILILSATCTAYSCWIFAMIWRS